MFSAESLIPSLGTSDDPEGVTLGPYLQPSQAIIDQDQEEQATISKVQDQQPAICPDQEHQAVIVQVQDRQVDIAPDQEQEVNIPQDQDQHTPNDQDHEQVSECPEALSDAVVISSHELKPDSPEKSLPDEKGTEGEELCRSIQRKSIFCRPM